MARLPDPRLRADWIARLDRFGRSALTVADFCADEGVSVSAFYQWRRKLRGDPTRSPPAFVSLRVRDAEPASDPEDRVAGSQPAADRQPLRVELPGGLVVACDERIDAERLAELLATPVRDHLRLLAKQSRGPQNRHHLIVPLRRYRRRLADRQGRQSGLLAILPFDRA